MNQMELDLLRTFPTYRKFVDRHTRWTRVRMEAYENAHDKLGVKVLNKIEDDFSVKDNTWDDDCWDFYFKSEKDANMFSRWMSRQ